MSEVHLLRVPVPLWARAQAHTDELLREFALMAVDPDAAGSLPARLVDLVAALNHSYGGASSEQEAQLYAAAHTGLPEIDLTYVVPEQAAAASRSLADLLDEADEFCLAGRHLLTLATPPDVIRFRLWYLGEFGRQIAGLPPVSWPAYPA